ncbi:hypothetical protein JCM12178A_25250 [Salidesulfovibrio brasiliensis]
MPPCMPQGELLETEGLMGKRSYTVMRKGQPVEQVTSVSVWGSNAPSVTMHEMFHA